MVATSHLSTAKMWHFFHNAENDLAEAVGTADLDRYAVAFEAAGAMRAGFEFHRAFDRDVADDRTSLQRGGKLTMLVLGLGAEASFFVPVAQEMLSEVPESVTTAAFLGRATGSRMRTHRRC